MPIRSTKRVTVQLTRFYKVILIPIEKTILWFEIRYRNIFIITGMSYWEILILGI